MDSAALTTYVETEWAEVLANVSGLTAAYIVGIVAEHYTADTSLEDDWAEPLADYYVLRRAVRAFSVDFDVSVSGDSYRLSQRKQIEARYAEARAIVEGADLIGPDSDATWTISAPIFIGSADEGAEIW